MISSLDYWKTAGDLFRNKLDELASEQWHAATNCVGWDVCAMVEHAIDYQRIFGRYLAAGSSVETDLGDDPASAWRQIRAALLAAYEAPGALDRTFDFMPFGETVGEQIAAPTTDLVIHTWDIARATGTDETLPEDICGHVLDGLRSVEDLIRAPGYYDPAVDPPPGADVKTQMLCLQPFPPRHQF